MLYWIITAATICLSIMLLANKKYSRLYLVQLFLLAPFAINFVYLNFLHNWYFYLASIIAQAALFTLAFWEVNKKLENRSLTWIWPVLTIILTVGFWPIPFLTKLVMPFLVINLFVVFETFYSFKSKNQILQVWTVTSTFAFVLGVLKLFLTQPEFIKTLVTLERWPRTVGIMVLLAMFAWKPVLSWLGPKLGRIVPNMNLTPVFATASNKTALDTGERADVIEFPVSYQNLASSEIDNVQQVAEDMNLLEPLLMNATRMISLSNKPFLNAEDLRDYLDLDDEQIDAFIEKYQIKKFHLLEDAEQWVVRRQDVENIPNDGTTSFHSRDKF